MDLTNNKDIYSTRMKLLTEHIDVAGRVKASTLMRIFQEACVADTARLGFSRQTVLEKGLIWVVASERIVISRMPVFDEEIEILCYPGPHFHSFFPRQLVIRTLDGEVLVRGCSIWTLIDLNQRKMISPKEYQIDVKGLTLENEVKALLSLPRPELDFKRKVTATYSLCDANGHLNNTSYLDVALDLLPLDLLKKKEIGEFGICFKKEIPAGTEFEVSYGEYEGSYYFHNDHFNIKVTFKD